MTIFSSGSIFGSQVGETQAPKLLEIQKKIKATPISQEIEIEGMDKIDANRIETIANLTIKSKLSEHIVKIKIIILFKRSERTESNPWGFQIEELSDATL